MKKSEEPLSSLTLLIPESMHNILKKEKEKEHGKLSKLVREGLTHVIKKYKLS